MKVFVYSMLIVLTLSSQTGARTKTLAPSKGDQTSEDAFLAFLNATKVHATMSSEVKGQTEQILVTFEAEGEFLYNVQEQMQRHRKSIVRVIDPPEAPPVSKLDCQAFANSVEPDLPVSKCTVLAKLDLNSGIVSSELPPFALSPRSIEVIIKNNESEKSPSFSSKIWLSIRIRDQDMAKAILDSLGRSAPSLSVTVYKEKCDKVTLRGFSVRGLVCFTTNPNFTKATPQKTAQCLLGFDKIGNPVEIPEASLCPSP